MDEATDGSLQPNPVSSTGQSEESQKNDDAATPAVFACAPPPPPLPDATSQPVQTHLPRLVCMVGVSAATGALAELCELAVQSAPLLGARVVSVGDDGEGPHPQPALPHYVLPEFEGRIFNERFARDRSRVLGPTAVIQLSRLPECQLPDNKRPLYSLSMKSIVVCFTGFRVKEELTYLITLIHYMGGSIRKDMSAKVTHLIANAANGEKYRYAAAFRVPVVGRSWVDHCWARRYDVDCRASDDAIIAEHKLKMFLGSRVCFIGFPDDECQHMTDILVKNGGESVALDDAACSHVVVASGEMYSDQSFSNSHSTNPDSRSFVNRTPYNVFMQDGDEAITEESMPSLRGMISTNGLKKRQPLNMSKFSCFDIDQTLSNDEDDLVDDNHYSPRLNDSNVKFNKSRIGSAEMKMKRRPIDITDDTTLFDDYLGTAVGTSSPFLSKLFSPDRSGIVDQSNAKKNKKGSKKRIRNSAESNFEVEILNKAVLQTTAEENNWKSPFKKLKIKDSFRFKGKDRPLIVKKNKAKNIFLDDDELKDLNDVDYLTSTPSPNKQDEDNISICSTTSNVKDRSFFASSGLFDISFSSLKGGRASKSVSKLRRSVKSLTASFRGERKKKYEKRIDDNIDEIDHNSSIQFTPLSTPFDVSPVAHADMTFGGQSNNTPLARISESAEVSVVFKTPSNYVSKSSPVIFKTPVGTGRRRAAKRAADSPTVPVPSGCKQLDTLSVVDEHATQSLPDAGPRAHVVKAEWFWASVQNEEAQDEKDYLFEDYLDAQVCQSRRSSRGSLSSGASGTNQGVSPPRSPAPSGSTPSSTLPPGSAHRIRKRKLRGPDAALHKRRSSVGDAVLLSLSGNLLDCTQSPDGKQSLLDEVECVSVSDAARKLMSPRQQVFMELVQTESNYVGILHTIVMMFKQPLEEMMIDGTNPLLNNTELKIIFGNLPPIYEIHRRMLEELKWSSHNWSEETSIGRIVLKYLPDLLKTYPPFVNFFENMKDMLVQCDRENTRFHAFLKICQTKPECGRQSLQELLIRPVQRLPSISLLLDDILKHTNKSNPDHSALESALAGVREVMAHVNEDKRKTEGQLQMFDIYNDIDNCPAHLVSSHRSFVARCEVMEITKDLSGKGDHLVLFLFTDTMEVCKKRSKALNSKSPPINGLHHVASRLGSGKSYRHIQLMPLSTVKRVIDIRESDECHKGFALMCRSNQELKEKLYSFTITDEAVDKTHFLRQLCRQMANTVCKADAEKFLACMEFHQLDIDTSDLALGTLSKAIKFASKTRIKVGRAFSFNKTPSKLKRAMSSMISPFGSTSNLTPASQLAQMRLASCNNINELGVGGGAGTQPDVLVAPMSVQPTRKAKASSLSAGALRRL